MWDHTPLLTQFTIMITILQGDLFKSETQTIVNTINCVGAMGKGIALEYKKRYPDMYLAYRDLCFNKQISIGKLWIYKTEDKWILNFPTKDHWRNPSEISYLEKGLTKFIETYKQKCILSIAFPILGAGNGGINQDVSLEIMIKYLSQCDIPIYIYKN